MISKVLESQRMVSRPVEKWTRLFFDAWILT